MTLKEIVDEILKEKDRPLSWLATGMKRTDDGLRVGLVNESVKYRDLLTMAETLEVSPRRLFEATAYDLPTEENMVSETSAEYGGLKGCVALVTALRSQIKDKERIIKLLSKDNIDVG